MKVERLKENIHPTSNSIVQLKRMGNITEIKYATNETGGNIKKIDKDNYIDTRTGEIKKFIHTDSRADNKASIAQSLKKLRDIINTNITDPKRCLWITLTYKENMTDHLRLYNDFRKFNARLCYYIGQNHFPLYEYIVAMEPQARGAWHAHMLMIFKERAPFIPNEALSKVWGHGFVSIKALTNVDNVGVYLTAYLGDMELSEVICNGRITDSLVNEVEITDLHGKKTKKHYIKGARLRLYPVGFRIFRISKGIKKPEIIHCNNNEAMQEISSANLVYEKTIKIFDGDEIYNIINYRQFNRNIKTTRKTGVK